MVHGCQDTPLIGSHLISYTDNDGFIREEMVHSLNSKRTSCWFSDKLSFERSTFIIHGDYVVRLCQIRHLIRLPLLTSPYGELSKGNMYVFFPPIRFYKDKSCVDYVSEHILRLIYRLHDQPELLSQVVQKVSNGLASNEIDQYGEYYTPEESSLFFST